MARPANPDPDARRKLVKAATKLILSSGYAATSVDDICREAAQTKGNFFHYFVNKEALGEAVLEQYMARVLARFDEIRAAEPDPLARVCACLDFLSASAEIWPLNHGCILGKLTQELAETHPAIRTRCAAHFGAWLDTVAADLEAAARRRRLKRSEARSLAEFIVASFEGALIVARAQGDATVVRRALAHTRQYLVSRFAAPPRRTRRPHG